MEPSVNMEMKKRKLEENGVGGESLSAVPIMTGRPPLDAAPAAGDVLSENGIPSYLTLQDVSSMIELLSKEDLASIVMDSTLRHGDVLAAVRKFTDRDVMHRKLFVRGLGWDTSSVSLRSAFSEFGELEEAIVIIDKVTGRSRGYGFVTYKHMDGAMNALKEPSKRIDGRICVCQLASAGSGSNQPAQDVAARKIYVGNVPLDWPVDRMLGIFSEYGEIEEGPLGLDKQAGKARGFALFIYKSPDSARRALEEPVKNIGGHQLFCKLASEGAKPRANMQAQSDISDLNVGQMGNVGLPPTNVTYGGPQYGGALQGQGAPYGQPTNSALNTGLNTAPSINSTLYASSTLYPSVAGTLQSQTLQSQPLGTNLSAVNPTLGSVSSVVNPAGAQLGLPSYGAHMDGYGQQGSSFSGQHGGYSMGASTSLHNMTPGSMTTQSPAMQGQYTIPSYQSQQQLPSAYQGQQQMPMSYQSQQLSAPRMQQSGGSMPYYGV